METKLKILGFVAFLANIAYLTWLGFNIIGLVFFIAEFFMVSLFCLFLFNHWSQTHRPHELKRPRGKVDIFLPVVNEDLKMFEATVKAASQIDYRYKKIYILDDGGRDEVKALAKKYKVTYFHRGSKVDYKAGNLNYAVVRSQGDYILVLDADQRVDRDIIKHLLGHFQDSPLVAMISTRQSFDIPKKDFNQDEIFYHHMQTGKDSNNAAISTGSGVFYRRSALEHIDGFQTWNLVEDLYTSYIFHIYRFQTIYINRAYTRGVAPFDLPTIYKQRGTWSLDTLRLFLQKNPFLMPTLNFRQKLHYTELAMVYIVSATIIPLLFLLPPITLLLDIQLVQHGELYVLFRFPSLIILLVFYYLAAGGVFSTSQYWAALWVVYLKSFLLAFMPFKTKYRVTQKSREKKKKHILFAVPHIVILCFNFFAIVYKVYQDQMITGLIAVNFVWATMMVIWFYPLIKKAFSKA